MCSSDLFIKQHQTLKKRSSDVYTLNFIRKKPAFSHAITVSQNKDGAYWVYEPAMDTVFVKYTEKDYLDLMKSLIQTYDQNNVIRLVEARYPTPRHRGMGTTSCLIS